MRLGKIVRILPWLLLSVALAKPALAETAAVRKFDLECREVTNGGYLAADVSLRLSIDLARGLACVRDNKDCLVRPVIDRGRWLDMSYLFSDSKGQRWEMSRIYDRQSGWLDQVIRKVGEPGNPYGDAACDAEPFTDFDTSPPAWSKVPSQVR